MADQELQIVEGFLFFSFFSYTEYTICTKQELGDLVIGSLEFVGLPPRGPNDTAQNLPKLNPSDRTG